MMNDETDEFQPPPTHPNLTKLECDQVKEKLDQVIQAFKQNTTLDWDIVFFGLSQEQQAYFNELFGIYLALQDTTEEG